LVHIQVPVPLEHGFDPSETIERARAAVESRVHPLFEYDPSSGGVFGVRVSIDGNPDIDNFSAGTSFFEWVLGEDRFRSSFATPDDEEDLVPVDEYLSLARSERVGKTPTIEDRVSGETLSIGAELIRGAEIRRQVWSLYREISGKESPFVERIRSDLRQEVEAEQRKSVEAMKREYETKIDEIRRDIDGKMASQLRDRLLTLAGFGPNPSQSRKE
jgi:pyruvate-ferredoxin/flavodoxin oxidoreductase